MNSDKRLKQADLDKWLNTSFCPAVEEAINNIKVPNSWVTDLSEGRQTSLNTEEDIRIWIKDRVRETEKILKKKDIDLEKVIIKPGLDFDGPINKLNSPGMKPHPGFKEAYKTILPGNSLNISLPVIISGRGHNFLSYAVKEAMNLGEINWAGENGCVYHDNRKLRVLDGESYHPVDESEIDYSRKIAFDREVWRKAAENRRKIIWASSYSPVSGTLSIEGEGINLEESRTEIRDNCFYRNKYVVNSDTERVWNSIESSAEAVGLEHGFERENPLIIFEDNWKNSEILSLALNMFSPGAELRFTRYKGKIAFYPCPEADKNFSQKDREEFIDEVVKATNSKINGDFRLEHHSDGWTDYMLSGVSKQKTAEKILEENKFRHKDNALFTYIGDRVNDVFCSENTLFFAQIGRPSKDYCEENNIDHVAVNNATDYCLIISELIHRNTSA